MAERRTVYRVFVASPSDVTAERELARTVIAEVGRLVGSRRVGLEAYGWEDARPGLGRPQERINPLVREADLLIGVLWRRFGTSTGVAESGTKEELDVIYQRWLANEPVDVMMYFRDVAPEMLEDPGPQLSGVLAFRKEMEQLGLYRTYAAPSDFAAALRSDLTDWLAERGRRGAGARSSRPRGTRAPLQPAPAELLDRFLKAQLAEHRYLQMTGFETRVRVPVELERVLVPLRARVAHSRPGRAGDKAELEARERDDGVIDLEEAWRRARTERIPTLVVLGHPGSGKTTLLRHLALRSILDPAGLGVPDKTVPLLLPVRQVRPPEDLDDAVRRILQTERLRLPPRFFDDFLFAGRGLLLLDGLDEVRSAAERERTARWIEVQRRAFPECPLLVTARFAGYTGDARLQIPHLELSLERFREPEIKAFLERWFMTVETAVRGDTELYRQRGGEAAAELWERVREAPEILTLAENPLMLQIIALVHRDRGALPERRVELYDECVNVLLEHWDRAKQGLDVPLTAKEARRVLRPIAYWMHQVPERRFASQEELMPLVERGLAEFPKRRLAPEDFIATIRDRSGLFTGYGVDEYGFQHLSFQEFLAAEEIRARRLYKDLVRVYGEVWWREVTRLLMGLENPSCFEDFTEELVRSDRFVRHPDLTAACIQDAFTVSAAPFAKALRTITSQRSRGGQAALRQYHLLLALRELPAEKLVAAAPALERVLGAAQTKENLALALELARRAGVERIVFDEAMALPELRVNPRDGSELVLIPKGESLVGHEHDRDNRPRRMTLESFYLARYPVTNAQYAKFLEANPKAGRPKYWDDKRFNGPQQPVVGVSWHEATAYCRWAGLRLPAEWEWEKGARGTDGRAYPWGDSAPDDTRANFDGRVGQTTPVGSYPVGASPYGLMDMAGNVWEWTASEYDKQGGTRTLRGGAFHVAPANLRAATRRHQVPVIRGDIFGFRCARDP